MSLSYGRDTYQKNFHLVDGRRRACIEKCILIRMEKVGAKDKSKRRTTKAGPLKGPMED